VGDGEQGRQGRQEERIGTREEEHPDRVQEGREARRCRVGPAPQGGALGIGPEGRGHTETALLGRTLVEVVELAAFLDVAPVLWLDPLSQRFALGALLRVAALQWIPEVQPLAELFPQPSVTSALTTTQGPRQQAAWP
jgi:hypothetical protein